MELILGPVEQPNEENLRPIKALPEFVAGFFDEFVKINNLEEISKCVDVFSADFGDV